MRYKFSVSIDCVPPSYWLLLFVGVALLCLPACDSGEPNQKPSADFSIEDENPRAGDEVTFVADASDPENKIDSLSWTFEGTNVEYEGEAGGETVAHTFPKKGQYEVELTVRDDIGSTAKATKTLDVRLRYSRATLTKTEVRKLIDWPDGNPDLYYVLSDSTTDLYTSSPFPSFSPPDVPVRFEDVEREFPDLSATYTISLWADDGSGEDERIKEIEFDFEENIACRVERTVCYPSSQDSTFKVLTNPPDPEDPSAADTRIWLHLNWGN